MTTLEPSTHEEHQAVAAAELPTEQLPAAVDDMAAFLDNFDDWVCALCCEGDAVGDGARTMHECGRHEFHHGCLQDARRRDIRCAICRFPIDAPLPNFSITQSMLNNSTATINSTDNSSLDSTQPTFSSTPLQHTRPAALHLTRDNVFRNTRPVPVWQDVSRLRPNVTRGLGVAGSHRCCYCGFFIMQSAHYELSGCHHHSHEICAIENMRENGCSANGDLYCMLCSERLNLTLFASHI